MNHPVHQLFTASSWERVFTAGIATHDRGYEGVVAMEADLGAQAAMLITAERIKTEGFTKQT